ncbi:MAG: hypothetical protein M1827_003112 [Pycnora praestabilis]|nr:MAG: hypothetical protein M1827_003112 [Pycnora praestabilis]
MSSKSQLVKDAEDLLAATKEYENNAHNPPARLELLRKVEDLHRQIDDPHVAMFRQFTSFSETASLRAMLQLGVLSQIPRHGSISARELASKTGVDETLLIRLMRVITATGTVSEVKQDEYAHTRFSLAYIEGTEVDFWALMVDEIMPTIIKIPDYIESHEKDEMYDPRKTLFSWANGVEGKTFYEALLSLPNRLALFNSAMTSQEAALPVLGMFPFVELDQQKNDEARPFLVDVGGGRGQSLLQIKKANPSINGKMILQDRQAVLDAIPEDGLPEIEKMTYDFFTPQPIKHALAYYFRRIMHNWPDDVCQKILSNTAMSMASDSRLLIAEMVVPERTGGGDMTAYWMDFAMLVIGGRERSEKDFRDLLDAAGLELVKIWPSAIGPQTVIEARLKGESKITST